MKKVLDWSNYHEQGMGDCYADIPKQGETALDSDALVVCNGLFCSHPILALRN